MPRSVSNTKRLTDVQYSEYQFGKKLFLSIVYSKLLQIIEANNTLQDEAEAYVICY